MKLNRTGLHRNAGTCELADEALICPRKRKWWHPKWQGDSAELSFTVTGEDRGSNYRYEVVLSGAEAIQLVGTMIEGVATDIGTKAAGKGIVAYLTELLNGTPNGEQVQSTAAGQHGTSAPGRTEDAEVP